MQSTDDLVRLCKALAAETRLSIIDALRGRCLCVNALASQLDLTHSAVSQHLRILREAGIGSVDILTPGPGRPTVVLQTDHMVFQKNNPDHLP